MSFTVSGEKRHTYYLQFPSSLVVPLAGDLTKDPDRFLHLEDLAASQIGQGLLPGDGAVGRASLGATRAQLRSSQNSGLYIGLLPVTVVYP